jgi:hypothetical protein
MYQVLEMARTVQNKRAALAKYQVVLDKNCTSDKSPQRNSSLAAGCLCGFVLGKSGSSGN